MKKITKIMLIIAGILATIGVICMVMAFAMGLTTNHLVKLIQDGTFSFDENDFRISFGEDEEPDFEGEISSTQIQDAKVVRCTVEDAVHSMDIELGAGLLTVSYDDVNQIEIIFAEKNKPTVKVKNGTLMVKRKAEIGIHDAQADASSVIIKIPRDMKFDEVDMELGASQAMIENLNVDKLNVEVGAGQATLSRLIVNQMDIEVGVGQVDIAMFGMESDYNYHIECGVGTIKIGETSYSGLASAHEVYDAEIKKAIDVECGIGEVNIKFGL